MKHTIFLALAWSLTLALFVACRTTGGPEVRFRSLERVTEPSDEFALEAVRADGTVETWTLDEVVTRLIEHNEEALAKAREDDPEYPHDAGLAQAAADREYLVGKLKKEGNDKKKCPKRNVGPEKLPSGSSDCWDHDNDGIATLHYCIDGTWYDTGEGCVPAVDTGG